MEFKIIETVLFVLVESLLLTLKGLDLPEIQSKIKRISKLLLRNLNGVGPELEDFAFEAYAVLDAFNYALCRLIVKNQESYNWIFNSHEFSSVCHEMAQEIDRVTARYDLGTSPVTTLTRPFPGIKYYSFNTHPLPIVGRDRDLQNIVGMLVNPFIREKINVLPIVGMGGVGKTTLAEIVSNDQTVARHFQKNIWVSVPEDWNALVLLTLILESFELVTVGNMQLDVILEKLRLHLEGVIYLLVLDDVLLDVEDNWTEFMDLLSTISSDKGNAIIVTTISETLASYVGTHPAYKLQFLSHDDCLSILKAHAVQVLTIPIEFEGVSREIGSICQGLPLVAKVLGGLLCTTSGRNWVRNLPDLRTEPKSSLLFRALTISFDSFPSPLFKNCLAYCSIFPKGFRIEKQQLIELWMAEGFLLTYQGNKCKENLHDSTFTPERPGSLILHSDDMEDMGNNIFNYFLQTSLLQSIKLDEYGNVASCKMHDLVHDVVRRAFYKTNKFWYFSDKLVGEKPHSLWRSLSKENAKYLRTLSFSGDVMGKELSIFKCLHVLKLVGADIKELPDEIGMMLIHLRLLDISYTGINYLPNSIGKLYNLQTLTVGSYKEKPPLKKMPNTIMDLIFLRHLHIPAIELPPGVSKLIHLQTLPYYKIGKKEGCRIGELKNLTNLKGEIEIHNLENVKDLKEAKEAHLMRKPNIFRVKFLWSVQRQKHHVNDEKVLEGLQPHSDLKSLEVDGFLGRKFPSWTMQMKVISENHNWVSLRNLMHVRFTNCNSCKKIPMFGHLPLLKSLYLIGLTEVKSISLSFYGPFTKTTWVHGTCFPALERLELSQMSNLKDWEVPEVTAIIFPCLEYLKIDSCPKLISRPKNFLNRREGIIKEVDGNFCFESHQSRAQHGQTEIKEVPEKKVSTSLVLHVPNFGSKSNDGVESSSCNEIVAERETLGPILGGEMLSMQQINQPGGNSMASYDEIITVPISITCHIRVDLKLRILHRSSRDIQHENVIEGYLFHLMEKVTEKSGQDNNDVEKYSPLSSALLTSNQLASSILLPKHLRCKGSISSLAAEERHEACLLWLTGSEKVLLPEKPDAPKLVFLCLQRETRISDIPPSFFERMPALRFLDLSGIRSSTLPSSLFNCTELQVLLLRDCVCLDKLPSDIGNLNRIEVLDLSGTELYDLPGQIDKLKCLKALQLSFYGPDDECEYPHLPSELVSEGTFSMFLKLQALSITVHPEDHRWTKEAGGIVKDACKLRELRQLEIYFPNTENLRDFVNMSVPWVTHKLRTFKFIVGHDVKRIVSSATYEVESNYDQLAQCLRFVNGDDIPRAIRNVLARSTSFCLDHHLEAHSLSQFEIPNFSKLKFCVVRQCPNIEVIIDKEINGVLPNLEYLGIHHLWKLQSIWRNQKSTVSFPTLKYLVFYTCPKLEFILPASMLAYLPNLEELVVKDCKSVTRITDGKIDKDCVVPRLRKLKLLYLPQLVSLGDGLSLTEEINSHACPNFKPDEKPKVPKG